MEEVYVTVEADTVGAGDNVDSRRHRLSKRVALVAGLVMRNVLAMGIIIYYNLRYKKLALFISESNKVMLCIGRLFILAQDSLFKVS